MKFLLNGSAVAALLSLSSHVDARISVPQIRDLQASNLDITVFGTGATIVADQTEYDQNQNHEGAGYAEVTGGTAKLVGNMWRSFELPGDGVKVTRDTVLSFDFAVGSPYGADFTAICADENTVLADERRCWVLLAKEGVYLPEMYNVPNTLDTPLTTFDIPIGRYFQTTVKHLVLIQDNDTGDQSGGESTFSNIAFENIPQHFDITINGDNVAIIDDQKPYSPSQQRSTDVPMEISADDPSSITLHGNTWKAYEFPETLYLNESTTLEFDFGLTEKVEVHAICLDDDTDNEQDDCFKLAGTQSWGRKVLKQTEVGEVNHYTIPIGHFFTGEKKYLGFGQDKDASPFTYGLSTFSNIAIYDEDRADLLIEVDGATVTVPNSQHQYAGSQDTREHVLEVSSDGLSATMKGNIFRGVALETPLEITKATQLEFDVELKDATNVDFIGFGLEDELSFDKDQYRVFGSKSGSNTFPEKVLEGESKHYSIPIGIDMTTNVTYLAFVQENDQSGEARKSGESTISNISIYERPDIMLKYGDGMVSVPNDQVIYDGNTQDRDKRNIWDVSDDGLSITMRDNNWKAVEVPAYSIEEDTVLMFDFTLIEETEIHGICLDDNLDHDDITTCFKVAGHQDVENNFYTVPDETRPSITSPTVTKTYAIRVGHFLAGRQLRNLVIVQDNDVGDKKGGESSFSNIHLFNAETCLLDDTSFTFTVDECTFSKTFSGLEDQLESKQSCSPNAWSELFGFFPKANYMYDVVEEIASICTLGYDTVSPHSFNHLSSEGYQFIEAFFDGDNKWNYEHDSIDDGVYSFDLAKEAGMISVVNDKMDTEGIAWPKMHNFKDCKLRAAMCCWVEERKDTDVTVEPTDNSDVCYVDFTRAKRSSHVKDGYSIYNGITGAPTDVEGAVNCHGFAWGNDAGYADSGLKGNTLFNVAMQEGLYTNGYVEEVPGAPLCACVEQMPVVTKASCTKIVVDQTVSLSYDHTIAVFAADVAINSIAYDSCNLEDSLSLYYAELVGDLKATEDEKAMLDEILVGDGKCGEATSAFLATKGLKLA
uniref:Uncharacterized protein n=1 Tax=Helicotheca tamesis TaxID=374047 RepID=A0A7S2MWT7_9STRA|mmetsp:Transcript_4841/g.6608  ORF Transcript_4841/g.6608 Transcript_4841/m.6608 type:complete len:1051 (+) Transcript_4841:149-3301(+)|eukprot:CAMPEP_0185725710 /NCGR_PEP_ID=MMETSP1171-20130828/1899_1 /TAXON_ID=374046 /ORGANISM="Helicotheca tamensis, Strain CCMP826" /LENGTH=1050 /DNA_ID=CAMNT_0028393903 /DNA_START=108 /DNA_END=3260 /DNA_ORIENTATION=+